jgi:hypothetical protein
MSTAKEARELAERLMVGRRHCHPAGAGSRRRKSMIVLGVIILIIGWLTHISILYTVGAILLVVGLVLLLLGSVGRGIGGRRHFF